MTLQRPASDANIHPSIARAIGCTLQNQGVCPKTLFAKVDLNYHEVLRSDDRIDGKINDELWRLATEATGDAIGLKYVNHVSASGFDGLINAWMASNNLYDAFQRLKTYFPVISTAGNIEVRDIRDEVHIAMVLPVPHGIANDCGVDSSLALFLQLSRLALGPELKPRWVEYQRPEPRAQKEFEAFYQCPIRFDSQENVLSLPLSVMRSRFPEPNPKLVKTLEGFMRDYLRMQQARNFVAEISMLVVDLLPQGAPSQQQIAEELHISRKTLQRRLSAEGTTLAQIVQDIREQQAHSFLRQDWRTISEVCYLLGFTEPSNFARWFKKTKGVSPLQYRDQINGGLDVVGYKAT